MNDQPKYQVPDEQIALSGPVARPEQTGLPIRGDLAHIALARHYLVANYVVPIVTTLRCDATLQSSPRADAEAVAQLSAGTRFELLDIAGAWAWGCLGPQGPAGYVPSAAVAE